MVQFPSFLHKRSLCLFLLTRGSAIARIIGETARELPGFEDEVRMWVYEEIVDGRKLTEIINTEHENIKYLPGFKIPENVVSSMEIDVDIQEYIYFLPPSLPPPSLPPSLLPSLTLYLPLALHPSLPPSQIACPDIVQTVQDVDILVFVLPHQVIPTFPTSS